MAGGVQRSGSSKILHGFPKVPSNVENPIELRRHLQSIRDALNEHRWLFGFLAGLNDVQQTRLAAAFFQLATQSGLIIQLDQDLAQTQTDLAQAQADLLLAQTNLAQQQTALQGQANALANANLTITQLQAQVLLLNSSVQSANTQIGALQGQVGTLQTAVTDIQTNCCP